MSSDDGAAFTLAYVPGVTPGKWARTWRERRPGTELALLLDDGDAVETVRSGRADAALVRTGPGFDGLSSITLYTETTVVLVPNEHLLTAADSVELADLADEVVLQPADDPLGWDSAGGRGLPGRPAAHRPDAIADAVELVAAGIGVLVLPQSLARLHHRRDLTYRPVSDAPQSSVALIWPDGETSESVAELIGVVRGRTANSSRGSSDQVPKRNARQKAADRRAAREAADKVPPRKPPRQRRRP